jgi:hypothetical protein
LGAPCGSCGNGVCLIHCPGNAFVCVANTTVGGPGPCSGDGECTDPGYPTCSGIQAHCSAGSTANPGGCRPLCP